ncbi:MAG: hypothetical protein JWM61_929 [Micrococcaceae bacterium]|nr:hypothetical protein [Micrococcaceae bacterium]
MTDSARLPVRPTKRSLDDLGIGFPALETPLSKVDHPLVAKAQGVPRELAAGRAERVRSLTDRVWLKCKCSNLRGVVTHLSEDDADQSELVADADAWWWLGAAGERKADSASDFYKLIEAEALRRGKGQQGVSSSHLLPGVIDYKRLSAELAVQSVLTIQRVVRDIIAKSLTDGQLWSASTSEHMITAGVRAADGEAYLAISAEGFPDARTIAIILASVPGMAEAEWMAEPGGAMAIQPEAGQIIYSAMIPAAAQAKILEEFADQE